MSVSEESDEKRKRFNENDHIESSKKVKNGDTPWLDYEQMIEMYAFNVKVCPKAAPKRCLDHPNCFMQAVPRSLRKGIWGQVDDLLGPKVFIKELQRADGAPCGLKNLGSTCYANSVFQCMYANRVLPKVLSLVSLNQVEHEDSRRIIWEMRKLFAFLSKSVRRAVNPEGLIVALGLCKTIQQDTLEFFKLLLTMLESTFSCVSDEYVKSFISDEFKGTFVHRTCCKQCNSASQSYSSFFEMSVPLLDKDGNVVAAKSVSKSSVRRSSQDETNRITLETCLDHYFAPESLSGTNQYFCDECQRKRDATRSVHVSSLPRTLNLQLMRFVYDPMTFARKKLSCPITIPYVLSFINDSTEDTVTYELKAVVSHFGDNTSSGHYVSEVCIESRWFRLNDDSVHSVEAPGSLDEEVFRTNRDEMGFDSVSAYLLVYKRTDSHEKTDDIQSEWDEDIEKDNEEVIEQAKVYETHLKGVSEFIERRKLDYECFKQMAQCEPIESVEEDDSYLIPSAWIKSWVLGVPYDDTPFSSVDTSELDSKCPGPIRLEELKCCHGHINPLRRSEWKRVSRQASYLLSKFLGSPGMRVADALCIKCCESIKRQEQLEEKKKIKKIRMDMDLKLMRSEVPYIMKGKTFPSPTKPPCIGKWAILPSTWLYEFRLYSKGKSDKLPGPIDTCALLCRHGLLLYSLYPATNCFMNADNILPCTSIGLMCEVPYSELIYLKSKFEFTGKEISCSIQLPSDESSQYPLKWEHVTIESDPEVCLDCCLERESDEIEWLMQNGEVNIKEVQPDSPNLSDSQRSSRSRSIKSKPVQCELASLDFNTVTAAQLHNMITSQLEIEGFPRGALQAMQGDENTEIDLSEYTCSLRRLGFKPGDTVFIQVDRTVSPNTSQECREVIDLDSSGDERDQVQNEKVESKTEYEHVYEEGFMTTKLFQLAQVNLSQDVVSKDAKGWFKMVKSAPPLSPEV